MKKQKGFSLIELLIVVAIILIIAAIAIPNLMRARMSANESSAAGSVRTINTGEVSYAAAYPSVGFATALANLGPDATPCANITAATGCFIDTVLAKGTKEGYTFQAVGTNQITGVYMGFASTGNPAALGTTGTRSFCSDQTGVIYYTVNTGACATNAASVLQ